MDVFQGNSTNVCGQIPPASSNRVIFKQAGWLLFLLLLLLPMIVTEIASLLYFATIIWCILRFPSEKKAAFQGMRIIWGFLAIFIIGLLQLPRQVPGLVIKDVWYFSLPILAFMTGWVYAPIMKGLRRYRILLIASLISGTWYLIRLIPLFFTNNFSDRNAYRLEAGTVDFVVVWGLLVALEWVSHRPKLGSVDKRLATYSLTINSLAIIFSLSRTAYIAAGLSFLVIWWPFIFKKWRLILASIIVLLIIILPLRVMIQEDKGGGSDSGIIANSIQEVSEQEFTTLGDVNARWRAYEALQAARTYMEGSPVQYLIGQGFGTLVDLQIEIDLGTAEQIRYIPILHNGYMYLLVKTGIIGLLIFLLQIISLWPKTKIRIRGIMLLEPGGIRMSRIILLSTILSTLVITGPYNKGGWFSAILILGMITRDGFKENTLENEKSRTFWRQRS